MSGGRVILHLVRHAESLWNVQGRYQGQADSGLTELGGEQASAVGRWLFEMVPRIAIVAASDLPRARDTAGPLAATLGVTPVVDPRLREVDIGHWAGKSFEEVAALEPDTVAAAAAGQDVPRGGGETFAQTRARVSAALEDLVQLARKTADASVVVVFTHGGPIRVAAADAVGAPVPGHSRVGPPANCSVTSLEYEGEAHRMLRYNRPTVVGVTAARNVREHEMEGLN
jgi:broad specificity phosphatase PhoE